MHDFLISVDLCFSLGILLPIHRTAAILQRVNRESAALIRRRQQTARINLIQWDDSLDPIARLRLSLRSGARFASSMAFKSLIHSIIYYRSKWKPRRAAQRADIGDSADLLLGRLFSSSFSGSVYHNFHACSVNCVCRSLDNLSWMDEPEQPNQQWTRCSEFDCPFGDHDYRSIGSGYSVDPSFSASLSLPSIVCPLAFIAHLSLFHCSALRLPHRELSANFVRFFEFLSVSSSAEHRRLLDIALPLFLIHTPSLLAHRVYVGNGGSPWYYELLQNWILGSCDLFSYDTSQSGCDEGIWMSIHNALDLTLALYCAIQHETEPPNDSEHTTMADVISPDDPWRPEWNLEVAIFRIASAFECRYDPILSEYHRILPVPRFDRYNIRVTISPPISQRDHKDLLHYIHFTRLLAAAEQYPASFDPYHSTVSAAYLSLVRLHHLHLVRELMRSPIFQRWIRLPSVASDIATGCLSLAGVHSQSQFWAFLDRVLSVPEIRSWFWTLNLPMELVKRKQRKILQRWLLKTGEIELFRVAAPQWRQCIQQSSVRGRKEKTESWIVELLDEQGEESN